MMKYINTHQHKLKRMIDKRGSQITRNLSGIKKYNIDITSFRKEKNYI